MSYLGFRRCTRFHRRACAVYSAAATGVCAWSCQSYDHSRPLLCSVENQQAKQKDLISDWRDPKKAAKLEVNYQTPEVVMQRHELMLLLQPGLGERVLDVGCGPGFIIQDIASAVGSEGSVDGVDTSDAMLRLASSRLSKLKNTSLHVANAQVLPFDDGSFDAVVIQQVLLYVPDVPKALAEVHRVLRPGGRVVICETDWNSLVVHTYDEERFKRIFSACCSTFGDAHLPPKLPGLLRRAGLQLSKMRTVAMSAAGSTPENTWIGNFTFTVVKEKGLAFGLPDSDVSQWLAEQRSLNEQGEFFACVHRFLFLAHKGETS